MSGPNNPQALELLARLDERMILMMGQFEDMKKRLIEYESKIERSYVTKEEFLPIKRAVYAAIGFILTAFLAVVTSTVFKPGGPSVHP